MLLMNSQRLVLFNIDDHDECRKVSTVLNYTKMLMQLDNNINEYSKDEFLSVPTQYFLVKK